METKQAEIQSILSNSFTETQKLYVGHSYAPYFFDIESANLKKQIKQQLEYGHVSDIPAPVIISSTPISNKTKDTENSSTKKNTNEKGTNVENTLFPSSSNALMRINDPKGNTNNNRAIMNRRAPEWHAPWEMMRLISGHTGWVRCCAVDNSNEWFATGSADRTIIVWDLASGQRKVTLTGHIATVRDICISQRLPYLFSVGEDKMVKCWDLEANQVVRQYHGHLNGVYCCALHPTIDLLLTGGRDASVRVWDIRSKTEAAILTGHKHTIGSILTNPTDPQVISGSYDSTVRLWDLAAGKCDVVLTNHKKAIRSLASHPNEFSFVSASADNIKQWQLPLGKFMRNFPGHKSIINSLAVNQDNVAVSAADDGSMFMWDWKTGHCFQKIQTKVQPGSLESEAGIFRAMFDQTGCRLITCEADKSIKIWREVPDATPDTHPNEKWQPSLDKRF